MTEMITDIDLILEQIRVAAGGELQSFDKTIQVPWPRDRMPDQCGNPTAPGKTALPPARRARGASRLGGLPWLRNPPYYNSLVGKLIVHGKTRGECLMRLKRALDEFVIEGVETTLPLFRALVREKDIIDGDYHIHWLEEFLASGSMSG